MTSFWSHMIDINDAWRVNTYIYWLRKIPLIGELFPESLYEKGRAKKILSVIFKIISFILNTATKVLYYFVFFALILDVEYVRIDSIRALIFLNVLAGSFQNHAVTISIEDKDMVFLRNFRIPIRSYYCLQMAKTYGLYFIQNMLGYYIYSLLFPGLAMLTVAKGLALAVFVRVIIDWLGLFLFARTGKARINWIFTMSGLVGLFLAYYPQILAYIPGFTPKTIDFSFLLSIWSILFFGVLAILSLRSILTYRKYPEFARYQFFNYEKLQESVEEAVNQGGQLKTKDLRKTQADYKLEGYSFLHKIFFQRHWKLFGRSLKRKLLFVGIPLLFVIAYSLYIGNNSDIGVDKLSGLVEMVLEKRGAWFYFLYMILFRENYTRAIFANLDKWMLHYSFYRRSRDVLECFFIRFKQLMVLNLPLIGLVALGHGFFAIFVGKPKLALVNVLFILASGVFLSIVSLGLYYLFQPYTDQMEMKDPVYGIFNGIILFIAILSFQVESISTKLSIVSMLVFFAISLILIFMVYKFAPKRFKLKG